MFEKIEARLQQKGIDPTAFRARVELAQNTWYGWRNGTVQVGLCALLAICDALDLSLIGLLVGDDRESTAAGLLRVVAHLPEAERVALTHSVQALAQFYDTKKEAVCES